MSRNESEFTEIKFLAEKTYVHHWPSSTPKWSDLITKHIDHDVNNSKEKKQIVIKNKSILINNYTFKAIKKIGLTVPLFKKQTTLVFEGHFEEFDAHVHISTKAENYLEIFNHLTHWRSKYFPDSILS